MKVLAIDPGMYASVALYIPGASIKSGVRWTFLDLPVDANERPDVRQLRDFIRRWLPDRAFIESVGPMPKQGIASTAKFMRSTGYLESCVICCDTEITFVTPQRWKKFHGLPKGAEKEDSRQLALKLFPELAPVLERKKDHGRAEAALMAAYGAECMKPIEPE